MNEMTSVPQVPMVRAGSFCGSRAEFRRLVLRGGLLELITLGFYRFWLATDMRRHLWANTALDGDAAEYTGTGKELLLGFLMAVAILAPLYIGYFLLGIEAESLQAFASVPLVALFYLFSQFAIYRARRYRLTRTVWRGVRFWMTGSGWAYALRASLWALAVLLTFGLLLPWRTAALERYKMNHSHYGELQGRFEGRGIELFKRGWWIWALTLAFLIVPSLLWLPYLTIVVLPALPVLFAIYRAMEWRWWLSGLRFGAVRLQSALPVAALIPLYWKVIGWSALLLLAFALYLGGFGAVIALLAGGDGETFRPEALQNNIAMLVLTGIGYLLLIVGFNAVVRIYLLRDLWAKVVNTTTVYGLDAAAAVAAQGELATALGEGFADGLDVAGF